MVWTGGSQLAITVAANRLSTDGSATNFQYTYTFYTSNGSASWVLIGGNGSPGHPFPTVGESPDENDELTSAEEAIVTSLGMEARITYFQNASAARQAVSQLQANCPEITNLDGNGNAIVHAYWTALNQRSFGQETAYRLVVAHEAHNGNLLSAGTMDIFNDDLGLAVARQFPNATDQQLLNTIVNRVSTGHGRRLVNEQPLTYANKQD